MDRLGSVSGSTGTSWSEISNSPSEGGAGFPSEMRSSSSSSSLTSTLSKRHRTGLLEDFFQSLSVLSWNAAVTIRSHQREGPQLWLLQEGPKSLVFPGLMWTSSAGTSPQSPDPGLWTPCCLHLIPVPRPSQWGTQECFPTQHLYFSTGKILIINLQG